MNRPWYRDKTVHGTYLKFTAIVVMAFGPILLLGAHVPTSGLPRLMMDILGWTMWGGQNFDAPTTRFLSALSGGFLFGWGVTIWVLSGSAYDAAPDSVRRAVVAGFVCWFVTDSVGSAVLGHPSNVAFNVFFLLLCVGPLWFSAAARHGGETGTALHR